MYSVEEVDIRHIDRIFSTKNNVKHCNRIPFIQIKAMIRYKPAYLINPLLETYQRLCSCIGHRRDLVSRLQSSIHYNAKKESAVVVPMFPKRPTQFERVMLVFYLLVKISTKCQCVIIKPHGKHKLYDDYFLALAVFLQLRPKCIRLNFPNDYTFRSHIWSSLLDVPQLHSKKIGYEHRTLCKGTIAYRLNRIVPLKSIPMAKQFPPSRIMSLLKDRPAHLISPLLDLLQTWRQDNNNYIALQKTSVLTVDNGVLATAFKGETDFQWGLFIIKLVGIFNNFDTSTNIHTLKVNRMSPQHVKPLHLFLSLSPSCRNLIVDDLNQKDLGFLLQIQSLDTLEVAGVVII